MFNNYQICLKLKKNTFKNYRVVHQTIGWWFHNHQVGPAFPVHTWACIKYASVKVATLKNLPSPDIFPQKRLSWETGHCFFAALLLPCHAIENQNTRNARALVFWAPFFIGQLALKALTNMWCLLHPWLLKYWQAFSSRG